MSQRSTSDHFLDPLWDEVKALRKALDRERSRRKELAERVDFMMSNMGEEARQKLKEGPFGGEKDA